MKVTFRPSRRGVAQFLGELESRVMEQLWRAPASTAREIRERLAREKPVAATTVLTVLDRLTKKGLVRRRREGGVYLFSPATSRREFEHQVTRSILEGLMETDSRPIVSTFVELVSHDDELLDELEDLVRRQRQ